MQGLEVKSQEGSAVLTRGSRVYRAVPVHKLIPAPGFGTAQSRLPGVASCSILLMYPNPLPRVFGLLKVGNKINGNALLLLFPR